jgi:HD-like signal output (HDOD) protein
VFALRNSSARNRRRLSANGLNHGAIAPKKGDTIPARHLMQETHTPQLLPSSPAPAPYKDDEIKRRLDACPKLASLQTINRALRDLINSEQSLNSQIAEIIRRDPSLSARLLRMVNSVYFGSSTRISNIEEAVFFLGLRQIRELSTATPVIEEMQLLHSGARTGTPLPWADLWRHSIGTAALTREILTTTSVTVDDDTDYLAGLLHNVGKVVMAYAFPEELQQSMRVSLADPAEVCAHERQLIGWDHARIGAYYLGRHQLSDEITFAVLYHNEPDRAPRHRLFAAAVQIADYLVRHAGISGGFEQVRPIEADAWTQLDGWKILFGADGSETALARAHLANALQRLPTMLSGLV